MNSFNRFRLGNTFTARSAAFTDSRGCELRGGGLGFKPQRVRNSRSAEVGRQNTNDHGIDSAVIEGIVLQCEEPSFSCEDTLADLEAEHRTKRLSLPVGAQNRSAGRNPARWAGLRDLGPLARLYGYVVA